MRPPLTLWWASPGAAQDYRAELLRPCDEERAARHRSARAEQEWRVSRALLQQALAAEAGAHGGLAVSLSHKHGHALAALAPPGWRLGADLERVRQRDIEALARWCCNAEEIKGLRMHQGLARYHFFYMLWTIKEAFVKAAGLDFPADMRSVGLSADGQGWRVRAPPGRWRARVMLLGLDWAASVVWSDDGDGDVEPVWRAARGCSLPAAEILL